MTRTVVALGGNAILPKGSEGTVDEELDAIRKTVAHLSPLLDGDVVVTHGNGPQVGSLLLQQQYADVVMPLDVLVAETQAQIGYLLQQALRNHGVDAATVVTQVVVDGDDDAFDEYSKPVGPFYTEDEAAEKGFETRQVSDDERGWRRVVPSPEPHRIVEQEQITALLDAGTVPVCVGGGGIPVVETGNGLRGVEAVVDKDHASQLLASELSAERLVFLTNVDHAYIDFGTDEQEPIEDIAVSDLSSSLDAGMFGEGSMRPKVAACITFIDTGGKEAIITTVDRLEDALDGNTGTRVRA